MEEEVKFKRQQIQRLTTELKSHYYHDNFFVDPDKKFIKLLQEIIVLFP